VREVDKHLHAAWRPSTRNGESDARSTQALNARDGTRREHFLVGDQRAIDIGEEEFDRRHLGRGEKPLKVKLQNEK
jgi:hypothetical protein